MYKKVVQMKVFISGIFLIYENNCESFFKNQKLTFKSETYGKPFQIKKLNLNIVSNQIFNISVQINILKLENLPINKIE